MTTSYLSKDRVNELFGKALGVLLTVPKKEVSFPEISKNDRCSLWNREQKDGYVFTIGDCLAHKDKIPNIGDGVWVKSITKDLVEYWRVVAELPSNVPDTTSGNVHKYLTLILVTELSENDWNALISTKEKAK